MVGNQASVALLAGGASTRMQGGDKLLETLSGVPLLRVIAIRALMTGAPVLIALPPDRPDRYVAVADLPVTPVPVPDAAQGMSASFRAIGARTDGPVLIVLADMPEIRAAHMALLLRAHDEEPCRVVRAAASDGTPGQPVIFPARLVGQFGELAGDAGGRSILRGEDARLVLLPGRAALVDLDTPRDWAEWRARTGVAR